MPARVAKFGIGQVVKHRIFAFRGVIFDVDPVFANTEEWWQAIPAEVRPSKDQPYYHLYAENAETTYVAYVSEQNLLPDTSGSPVRHPQVSEEFERLELGDLSAAPPQLRQLRPFGERSRQVGRAAPRRFCAARPGDSLVGPHI